MRQIRFRAWSKRCNDFVSPQYYCSIDKNGEINTYNPIDDITLEQFTGLKDKNGVDIYEGDKLKWINEDGFSFTGTIFWRDISCMIDFDDKTKKPYEDWLFEYCDKDYYEIEVIGNIHQNK